MNMFETVRAVIEANGTSDPEEILLANGVKIFQLPMTGLRGIYKAMHDIPMVFVDSELEERQKRFVLAHELAHHLFHRGLNRVFLERCTFMKTDCYEREAELFAACLLCPYPEEYIFEGETVSDLAHRAGFSDDVTQLYLREYQRAAA
ncbi:MAG: ImmA/IrrE family metallo-endopeptidase [Oscillospiraceae bacterium]|nr:ImmA/IrrE family metallo-endopeptidase [Oscillospiraceae bacterium]